MYQSVRAVFLLVLLLRVAVAEESSPSHQHMFAVSPQDTPLTYLPDVLAPQSHCIYKEWSAWAGHCPPANACGGGIQTRTRAPAGHTKGCGDTTQQQDCDEKCVHVQVTKGLIFNGMIDNPASTKTENPISAVAVRYARYTYGSLSACSQECHDIDGLDRNYDIVCVMCTNQHSCNRAGGMHLSRTGKLDFVRNTRQGPYVKKVEGRHCTCSFTPEFPLMGGVCSAPSYYMNLTVL